MATESINGQTAVNIKVIGLIIKYQVLVNINGMIREVTEDTGKTIICMVKEYTLGQMEENMKENTLMIKSMDTVYTHIQTEGAIKANGKMVNSMVKGYLLHHKVPRKKVFGRMVKGCSGLMMMNERLTIRKFLNLF